MARIIPDISGAFGMPRPHLQKFRRPQAPKRSGAQEAADIMSLIQSGVGTAAGLYGLGRGIYEDFRETDDEAVARLQREAIEQRAKFMQPGAATLEFGVKPEFAAPESVGWTDEPRLAGGDPLHGARYAPEAMTQVRPSVPGGVGRGAEIAAEDLQTQIALGLDPRPWPAGMAPEVIESAQPAATTRTVKVPMGEMRGDYETWYNRMAAQDPGLTSEMVRQQVEEAGRPAYQKGQEGTGYSAEHEFEFKVPAATLDTPDNRAIVQKAVEAAPTPEAKRALVERVRAEGQSAIDKIAAYLGWTAEDIESLEPLQRAGLQLKGQELERAREQAERALPSAVTAREFLDRSFEGEQFNISDLASSYGGLMARGKEAEARELLRLARGAGDYASFITNPNEPPSLVEARARDAIKKGALAQPADVALTAGDLWEAVGGKRGRKGRKASRKPTPPSKKKPPAEGAADDGIRRKVLKNVGIGRVDEMSDAQVQSAFKDAVNKAARGVYGKGKAAELKKKFGVDVLASDAAVKRAVGAKREERAVGAAEAGAAAQAKRAKTGAEKAADKKKEGHKKALTSVGMRYSNAVGNVAAHKSDLASRVSNKKAKIAKAKKSLRNLGEGGTGATRIRAKIKALEGDIAVIVTAQNALDEIEAAPAMFGLPSFTVPTD